MKYNLIQTLGKYKCMEYTSENTGNISVEVNTVGESLYRMMFSWRHNDSDIAVGKWKFSKIVDVKKAPGNTGTCNVSIEGINPDGKEFAVSWNVEIPLMKPWDLPLNVMISISSLGDLDLAYAVLKAIQNNKCYNYNVAKKELEQLNVASVKLEAMETCGLKNESFKSWITRSLSSRIDLLSEFVEQNEA